MPLDSASQLVPSVCPHDCPSACALDVERLDARTIGRVHGAKENSYTAGIICAKVARYAERQHSPLRLRRPLRRVGPRGAPLEQWQPLTWDQALDETAERFARIAAADGPEAIWPYFYAGTMGLVQRDSINRLRHAMGWSGQKSTICVGLSDSGWIAGVGQKRGVDAREMAQSDLIVLWGCNAVHTQVNVMTHVTRARRARGARLVVVDPYPTATAAAADIHLAPRPGTDAALALAVMHVLFRDGYADRDWMARYTDDPAGLEDHVASRSPAWAEPITGIPASEIEAFARLYGQTARSFIRLGYGFSRSRNGAVQVHAVTCLPSVTGAWQHPGGGALYSQSGRFALPRDAIEAPELRDPATRVLDQSRIGPVLTGDPRDLGAGPPVRGLLIQNTNPMVVAPDLSLVHRGFARDDLFTVVHEQFPTETALMADILLPATTMLEHDDIYVAGGHSFVQVARRVVEPPGEARENLFVINALAERLGVAGRAPGFRRTAIDLIEDMLARAGLPAADAVVAARGHDVTRPFAEEHFLTGFPHADGRFHFRPGWAALGPEGAGMPELPEQWDVIEAADPEHPFRLITAPSRSFLNSSFNETPSGNAREQRPTAQMAPADLAALGLVEGTAVRLGNGRGSVVVHAAAAPQQRPGVVVVEGLWRNGAFVEGVGINALTSAEAGRPNGGAVFHDSRIWVRPAQSG